jgi:hypothetical protein
VFLTHSYIIDLVNTIIYNSFFIYFLIKKVHMDCRINSSPIEWTSNNVEFEIRDATVDDVNDIFHLVNEAYSESSYGYYRVNQGKGLGRRTGTETIIDKIINKHLYTMFVCVKKNESLNLRDQIVGTIYLRHHREEEQSRKGEICMYAIDKNFRSKFEVGLRLLQQVECKALSHKMNKLILDVVDAIGEDNQLPLINHYNQKGYTFTGEKETIDHPSLIQPITLLRMEKDL